MSSEISNKAAAEGAQVIAFRPPSGERVSTTARELERKSATGTLSGTDEAEKDSAKGRVSQEQLTEMVSKMNSHMQDTRRSLQFSIDEDNGSTVVKVIEAETKEVIRQIPSEELLALSKRLEENAGRIIQAEA